MCVCLCVRVCVCESVKVGHFAVQQKLTEHWKSTIRKFLGVPVMAQQKQIQLGTMRLRVGSLASRSGLGIRRCCELWCKSQVRLRSGVAMALA